AFLDVALDPRCHHGGHRVGFHRRRCKWLQPVLEAADYAARPLAALLDGHLGDTAEARPALLSEGVAGDDVEARRAVGIDAHAVAGKLWIGMEVARTPSRQGGHLLVGEHLAAGAALRLVDLGLTPGY